MSSGKTAYRVDTNLSAGSEGWDGATYYSCDSSGTGLFMEEWNVNMAVDLGLGTPIDLALNGVLSSPRKDLPAAADMGSAGSWSYNYTISVDNELMPIEIPTSGTYQEMGFTTINVAAGTFNNAYCVSNTYTQDRSALDAFGMGGGKINAYSTLCYAEGIGLVKEETIDSTSSEIIMVKELASYSGF
jgi:hypothetical protein